MYINTGYQITNTPTVVSAGYNTWPYSMPQSTWNQHVARYYVDHNGNIQSWNSWDTPVPMYLPGGMYNGTPTRTGGYYQQNVIIAPNQPGHCKYYY